MNSQQLKARLYMFWRKGLPFIYAIIILHVAKDILQDFLELDFLYFLDVNENLLMLPQFLRWIVVVANILAAIGGFYLVFTIPLIWIRTKGREITKPLFLEKVSMAILLFFLLTAIADSLLDSRFYNPKLFLDKSTRKPASEVKKEYLEILKQGPF